MNAAILNEKHEIIPCDTDTAEWLEADPKRKIVKQETIETKTKGTVWISTVFLGLDHSFGAGCPLWFETMVFLRNKTDHPFDDHDMDRYSTWDQAVAGHEEMVSKWKNL